MQSQGKLKKRWHRNEWYLALLNTNIEKKTRNLVRILPTSPYYSTWTFKSIVLVVNFYQETEFIWLSISHVLLCKRET